MLRAFTLLWKRLFGITTPDEIASNYEFLVNLRLSNLHDVFDPEAIWNSDYNAHAMTGMLNEKPFHYGLYKALLHTPLVNVGYDKQRNLPCPVDQYFTDVVIYVDARKWKNQAQIGGGRLYIMANRLAAAHAKDFRGRLLNERQPRYCIMPAKDGLLHDEDEIFIQYGLSVFVPDENDQLIANIVFRHNEHIGFPLGKWTFFDNRGRRHERPMALYAEQKCLRFAAPNSLLSCFNTPAWFTNQEDETIMLLFDREHVDTASGQAEAIPGEKVTATKKPAISTRGVTTYAFFDDDERIALECYPVDYRDEHIENDHNGNLIRKTYVGISGNIEIETSLPIVYLSHIALPDQSMLAPNFDQWQLAFDQQGQLMNTVMTNTTPFIRFFLQEDKIYYQSHQMETPVDLAQVSSIQLDKLTFEVLPTPEVLSTDSHDNQTANSRYKGLLTLPPAWRKSFLYFSEQRTVILGREHEACHHNLLQQEGTLFSKAQPQQETLHNFYFSGTHAELSFEERFISVRQLSSTAPIIILNQDMQRINQLMVNDPRMVQLTNGQALILGCYTYQVRFKNT